jgi:regulator of protease activity HflC (stomatin/prohibitin superfamily)
MSQSSNPAPAILVSGALVVAVFFFLFWVGPQYNIYSRTAAGRAALQEAESTRQVRVLEAKAKMESASLEADAEIARAKGVAEANKIIGSSLQDNPRYLQYLYITGLQEGSEKGNRTIYVPTEGGVPIPTLSIDK